MSGQHDDEHSAHTEDSLHAPPRKLTRAENKVREIRTKAIESLLLDAGLVSAEGLDAVLHMYERDLGPLNGAKVVARAWMDPVYKDRLLKIGTAAIAELGFGGLQGEHLVVVENTATKHNVIVCTLCSCYPWPVLGLPPFWYKSLAYRSRVGGKPREVLREFGVELDESVEIFVWNSSASIRYLVLPERPASTKGMTEEELAALVTRDAMLGVARVTLDKKNEPVLSHRRVADMAGETALPRQSGELIFNDPWEGEAFAMAVALCESGQYPWEAFQQHLISEIAAADQQEHEVRPTYYECWLVALETLLLDLHIFNKTKIDNRANWLARVASGGAMRAFLWLTRDDESEEV
jgi:nitrile hydratase